MIYFIKDGEFVKIGYSNNPESRASNIQCGVYRKIDIIGVMEGDVRLERMLHTAFDQFRSEQGNEWFFLSDTIRNFIRKHCEPYKKPPCRIVAREKTKGYDPVKKTPWEESGLTKTNYLAEWLEHRLSSGPVEVRVLRKEVLAMGYAASTLYEAGKLIGVAGGGTRGKAYSWAPRKRKRAGNGVSVLA